MYIECDATAPPTLGSSWEERQEGPDRGLISAWLGGFSLAREQPALVAAAQKDELPVLPFRGGLDRAIKVKNKVGALQYIAMWHGLRGENLRIDPSQELQKTCSRTHVTVTFTSDITKLLASETASTGDLL